MKTDDIGWMDRLHKMRAEEEEKRQRECISMAEWLRRVNEEADAVLARVREQELPSVAREKPQAGN